MSPSPGFTGATRIQDALERDPRVVDAFFRLGLKCPGRRPGAEWCVAVEKETLEDAARFHEIDLAVILAALNALDLPEKKDAGA